MKQSQKECLYVSDGMTIKDTPKGLEVSIVIPTMFEPIRRFTQLEGKNLGYKPQKPAKYAGKATDPSYKDYIMLMGMRARRYNRKLYFVHQNFAISGSAIFGIDPEGKLELVNGAVESLTDLQTFIRFHQIEFSI